MIRGNKNVTTARMAICAALLCGTSAAFAQDAAIAPMVEAAPSPPVTAPVVAQPTPEVATVVAPPPAVATISEEQLVNPVAATQRSAARRATTRVSPARSAAAPVAPVAVQPGASPIDLTEGMVAPVEDAAPAAATVEATAAIAPVEQNDAISPVDGNDDTMILVGGIAAALGLAGIGAVWARRRRPVSQHAMVERTETVVPIVPAFAAPIVAARAEPMRPAVIERAALRFMPSMADRDLPPVTDPLFAHQVELTPVTDPLFAHEAELAPVTDPMFADHDEYAGNSSVGSAFDKRRTWPAAPDGTMTPVRELEPAA